MLSTNFNQSFCNKVFPSNIIFYNLNFQFKKYNMNILIKN